MRNESYMLGFGGNSVWQENMLNVAEGPSHDHRRGLGSRVHIPSNYFHYSVLSQTLHLVYNVDAALQILRRILKRGDVVSVTFLNVSQISRYTECSRGFARWQL